MCRRWDGTVRLSGGGTTVLLLLQLLKVITRGRWGNATGCLGQFVCAILLATWFCVCCNGKKLIKNSLIAENNIKIPDRFCTNVESLVMVWLTLETAALTTFAGAGAPPFSVASLLSWPLLLLPLPPLLSVGGPSSSSSSDDDHTQSPASVRWSLPLAPWARRLVFAFLARSSMLGAMVNREPCKNLRSCKVNMREQRKQTDYYVYLTSGATQHYTRAGE